MRSAIHLAFLAASWLCLLRVGFAQPEPLTDEFQVNSGELTLNQDDAAVAMDSSGDFVVVWESGALDVLDDVFARRYDEDGVPQGDEFRVNERVLLAQNEPDVGMSASGDFVVVFESLLDPADNDGEGVVARRFSRLGVPQGGEFLVNTVTAHNQRRPKVALMSDGAFIVAWESDVALPFGGFTSAEVRARRYNAAGVPLDANELQINLETEGSQGRPDVAVRPDGARYVVVWEHANAGGQPGIGSSIFARVFQVDSEGTSTPVTNDIAVNTEEAASHGCPSVGMDEFGNFVIAWERDDAVGMKQICARRFSANGSPMGGQFQVNTYVDDDQEDPAINVSMDSDGFFVVVWESAGQDGSGAGVFGQYYDPDGVAVGPEFMINQTVSLDQDDPAVAVSPGGNFVVAWESRQPETGGRGETLPDVTEDDGIYARLYAPPGSTIGDVACDIDGPTTTCPGAIGVVFSGKELNGRPDVTYEWTVGGGDIIGPVDESGILVDFGDFCGDANVTLSITDALGNKGSCSLDVSLVDEVAPVLTVPPNMSVSCGTTDFGEATATDNCPAPVVITSSDTFVERCGDTGLVMRTWTATDVCGNTATGMQMIVISDSAPPVLVVPPDADVGCGDSTDPSVTGMASATDDCGTASVTFSDAVTPGPGATGVIVRTWTATDECGSSTSADQTITMSDLTPPDLVVPANVVVEFGGDTSTESTGMATASDGCGDVTVAFQDVFGPSCGPTGMIMRMWTATDASGNQAQAPQMVQVVDRTPPDISCPFDVTLERGEPMDPVSTGHASAWDLSGDVDMAYVDRTMPETGGFFQVVERTWTATDACSNWSSCVQMIQVADDCIWDQGGWDGETGQTSGTDTSDGDTRAADDFCLKEGFVYEITSITVQMLTNASDPDATLQIYSDRNGCPGVVIDCGWFKDPSMTMMTENVLGELDLVEFTFDTGPRTETDEYGAEVDKPALWLKGGCYWVSPVGIGDPREYDNYYWATAGGDVLAAIAKAEAAPFKVDGWRSVDGLNLACRNFAFTVKGESCCILQDNGEPSDDVTGWVDTTGVGCRNVDDIVIPLCSDASEICFFSAYVWTNCDCSRTKLSFFGSDCAQPQPGTETMSVPVDKCVQLTGFGSLDGGVTVDDQDLALYRVEWHHPPVLLQGSGFTGWAAIRVQGSGSLNERGFWAFGERCDAPDIRFSPGQAVCPPRDILNFETVDRDYAFCVAMRQDVVAFDSGAGGATEEPACAGDMNEDGMTTVQDILMFLDTWLEGCDG